jgi:hypothetical protein
MPSLELRIAAENPVRPATRLRRLLETPGAAILRRNYVPEIPGYEDPEVRSAFRIAAVLAVDLSNPPEEQQEGTTEQAADEAEPGSETADRGSFAKGLEIWIAHAARSTCVFVDADEIGGALAMFDAYQRLARYAPALQRLEERVVGLQYGFREGLNVCIAGSPADVEPRADSFFEKVAPIPQVNDFRAANFTLRLSGECIGYFQDSLRAAAAWLEENSYGNILGTK